MEPRGELVNYIAGPCREVRRKDMGSSREYWLYAKECARWAAETKNKEDQDLFIDMAKAWTNMAIVENDVAKVAACELAKKSTN